VQAREVGGGHWTGMGIVAKRLFTSLPDIFSQGLCYAVIHWSVFG